MEEDAAKSMEMAAISKQRVMHEITALGNSDTQKFYSKATIFITGGTGFLGKQLIEKLLRACDPSKIYLLLRPKKVMDIQTRLADTLKDPVYNTLRKIQPNFHEKIIAINGDVASIGLGITGRDWLSLSNEVEIIFHLAATTSFDETLRVATLINVRGAREMIYFAKSCTKLRSYVHVSTAYSHATQNSIKSEVDEKFHSSPITPETLISLVENLDENRLLRITSNLMKGWSNSYTFTKAVAEEVVRTMSDGLPLCIVRPGIVGASYREPLPGWLDEKSIFGVSGVITGILYGVVATVCMRLDIHLAYIPCDYVNNTIIVSGRETASNQGKGGVDTKIYNVACYSRNAVSGKLFVNSLLEACSKIPSPKAVYYNPIAITDNMKLFTLSSLSMHTIPAYILDCFSLLCGKTQKFVKLYTKINKMLTVLSFFGINEWKFVDCNLENLFSNLKEDDKIIFNFDVTTIDWKEYFFLWVIGVRKYIIKDGLRNTEYALKKQFWFRILHYILVTVYVYGIWKLVCLLFSLLGMLFTIMA